MTFKFKDAGGVLQTVRTMKASDGSGLRNILRVKVMASDDTTLRTVAVFATTLSLSATPSVFAQEYASIMLSDAALATPSGGLGPYTYSWAIIAGSATPESPTSASCAFISPTLSPGDTADATARCTCTDSSGQTATADVLVGFFFPPS